MILLTLTMIGGVITVVAVLVTRIPDTFGGMVGPVLPDAITLPQGVTAQAVTFGTGWVAVVGAGDGAERNPDLFQHGQAHAGPAPAARTLTDGTGIA